MRVAMVSKHFYPYLGGLEYRVLDLSRWLAKHDVEVLVFTSHEKETSSFEDIDGIKVYRSSVFLDVFNALFSPGILLNLLRKDYDLIDVNLPDPVNSISALIASVLKRKPMAVTYHADIVKDRWYHIPFKLFYRFFERLVLWKAKIIFATSPDYAESSKTLKRYRGKIKITPNFVDPQKYNPQIDAKDLRKKLAPGGEKIILFVGRFVPYKGLEYLIDAFKIILDKQVDAKLVLVGSGELEEKLKKQVSGFGLDDSVVFAGRVGDDSLAKYYAACDVFALPSVTRAEAFGIVLAEAMACGKPTVTTNISGMPYVVGEAGLTVEPRNPKALSEALIKLLSDEELAVDDGVLGRRRVEELFTADAVCGKIKEEYESLVK